MGGECQSPQDGYGPMQQNGAATAYQSLPAWSVGISAQVGGKSEPSTA